MYRISKADNRIQKLEARKFSDLGFRERDHLQEWLANYPEALEAAGLLIIQKEFDGFDDTRERLDLLALDRSGNLVVIENKLDDSGRDVTWQALKYASYCSTLTKSKIVKIYQQYLDKYESGGDARANIVEFLDEEDFDLIVLNKDHHQRIMFVANHFRKEVTSTVLWLLKQQIQIQCFKATPYSMGDELFLQVDQIIPTPEAREYMIGINEKEQESKSTESELQNRHHLRLDFWRLFLDSCKESKLHLYTNINPGKNHWLSAGSGISGVPFTVLFMKKYARVELMIRRADELENTAIFDELLSQRSEIEETFGGTLEWERLEAKKACRIKFEKEFDGYNRESWSSMVTFLIETMTNLEIAFKAPLVDVNRKLKAR
ncbi:DUF4268 domain-containing protein [Oceanospirillaceae bacterium]|nr:DUF4268 domain-containing protein [Oceanospirillaceae bacterium]